MSNTTKATYRIRCHRSGLNTGAAREFAIEVYSPRPRHLPWRVLEAGFASCAAAEKRLAELSA